MELLSEYGLFLAKTLTFVVAAVVLIAVAGSAIQRSRHGEDDEGELTVRRLNEKYRHLKETIESRMVPPEQRKAWKKALKKAAKARKKSAKDQGDKDSDADKKRPRTFVVDFDGDIKASDNETLRKAITTVLSVAEPGRDEVVVRLESGGGLVHAYGLAAAQLDRVRSKGIRLTACVDKVAASGGYMMACVADRIVASPFAVLGSIGVVAQLPNFHRVLKKHDVDYEILTAGEHKRTLTLFGENTEKGRKKFLEDLEDTHHLFKDYVSERRPELDIDAVATGDIWFGTRALKMKLIDELKTSDEYLIEACDRSDVVTVSYERKRTLPEKLGLAASTAAESTFWRIVGSFRNQNIQ
ncbi:inner membrane peptidase. Serine peptidase. MEROPS family S49 [Marinobacter daqiaonensis]|uniref:Inner membrane peptidase. Serine peptidase. MEROPS family S49 n=1 Tax=Marinobacter daqiaonensis TaxID=650891 RepID=A0A1I6GV32_9GAMM|nr:protease SohB [Marinobacter daqiaonensis]SFR46062.1 inner membrane peptidase. Serine peptidase. MEROPS family S49 [Marinobacter daqiaonensis]